MCRLSESILELDGAEHTEGSVATVVYPLDPVADSEFGLQLVRPQVPVVELNFIVTQNDSSRALSRHAGAADRSQEIVLAGETDYLR